MTDTNEGIDRRVFLRGAAAAGAAAALAGPFGALGARTAAAGGRPWHRGTGDYGPLAPVRDRTTGLELLALPAGFEYLTYGWTNDPMADGSPTPGAHDGMAAFRVRNRIHLVRNHERGEGTPFAGPEATYDPAAGGGTTTLVFDPRKATFEASRPSLSGTIRNCAGGPTPTGSWLTCEETTAITADGTRHGYVFEVPAAGTCPAVPLKAMGRFSHEAAAVDPWTGHVYLTEDAGSSAIYRFRPNRRWDLAAGGTLEAMRLAGTEDTAGWETGAADRIVEWVTIDNPDWGPGEATCWEQASAKGAARIVRGEGAWYGNGVVYLISTSGGPAGQGQVFALDPRRGTFTSAFTSPSAEVLNAPDNVTVSPRGGLVLCEDGGGTEYLHGLTPDGEIFRFAENTVVLSEELAAAKGYGSTDFTGSEWAGATFEPVKGDWLFVNIQSPGITFAITGPWRRGAL